MYTNFTFIYLFIYGACMMGEECHTCYDAHMEVKGQLVFCQPYLQVSLLTELFQLFLVITEACMEFHKIVCIIFYLNHISF